jgi:hypothetical protein
MKNQKEETGMAEEVRGESHPVGGSYLRSIARNGS